MVGICRTGCVKYGNECAIQFKRAMCSIVRALLASSTYRGPSLQCALNRADVLSLQVVICFLTDCRPPAGAKLLWLRIYCEAYRRLTIYLLLQV
jgi:hypothetical protein